MMGRRIQPIGYLYTCEELFVRRPILWSTLRHLTIQQSNKEILIFLVYCSKKYVHIHILDGSELVRKAPKSNNIFKLIPVIP